MQDSTAFFHTIARSARILGLLLGLTSIGLAYAEPPRTELSAGLFRIEVEVASDPDSRAIGLMHRRELGPNRGMIFIFAEDRPHCMWMRNTLIPLSVAFLDLEGRIINIEEMKAQTQDTHCARRPARYALEMNAGWFAGHKIVPGTRVGGIAHLPEGK